MKPSLFDSHCHLTWEESENPALPRLERARKAGVKRFLCVAIDLDNAQSCANLAAQHADVFPSVGIHPNDLGSSQELPEKIAALKDLAANPAFVAIGETGLDFFRTWSEAKVQQVALRAHLELSLDLKLPIILHCRTAIDTLLPILREYGPELQGVMHCYSEGPKYVEELLALGLHISFAGNLTYPKSEPLREACRIVPLERLLLETDAPFLAPQPCRGQRNEPAFMVHTLETLAAEQQTSLAVMAAASFTNASRLFQL